MTATAPTTRRAYSPTDPYDRKGDWIRHDLLALVPTSARRLLSIGCGSGATESRLQQKGVEVWGIDLSADAIDAAREQLHHARVADIELDALEDLRPTSFDLVMLGDVLEHLRFTEYVLDRIRGWLTDDGHVLVAVPNATHYSVIRTLVFGRDWKYEDSGLFDRGHYKLFTKKSLLRLLGEHGFAVEEVTCDRVMSRWVRWTRTLLRPAIWLFPGLDEYFVYTWTVRARKTAATGV